jgi:DNA primase
MLLDENFQVRVLELEQELDPDEYVKQAGAEAYRGKLETAPAYFHWLADRARKKFDMRTVEGRLQGFKFVAPAIQRISDRLERFAVGNDVAHYLGVDEKLVREHFSKGSAPRETPPPQPGAPLEERLLLKSLIASEEARVQAIPQLRRVPALDRYVTKNIFKALFSMHEDALPFRFADLEGRLSEADRDLLSAVVFADDRLGEETAIQVALDCLRRLVALEPQSEVAALRAQIKAAERGGNLPEAMRLTAEFVRKSSSGSTSRK